MTLTQKIDLILVGFLLGLTSMGCAPLAVGAGAAGAATAYEAHSKYELDKLNRDYESGRMTKEEYENRKKQVEKGSLVY